MKAVAIIQYGFKQISPTNFMEPDGHPSFPTRLRGEKWVRACLKPKLEAWVPDEVAFLFEVARGSLVYGMFFLPLTSLAGEQCYRVLEAGVRNRCLKLVSLAKKRTKDKRLQNVPFSELLAALRKAGKIPEADLDAWTTMPFLRNRYSHPVSQTIVSRESALEVVAITSGLLNRLYQ